MGTHAQPRTCEVSARVQHRFYAVGARAQAGPQTCKVGARAQPRTCEVGAVVGDISGVVGGIHRLKVRAAAYTTSAATLADEAPPAALRVCAEGSLQSLWRRPRGDARGARLLQPEQKLQGAARSCICCFVHTVLKDAAAHWATEGSPECTTLQCGSRLAKRRS